MPSSYDISFYNYMYFKVNLARIITPVDIKPLSLDFQEKNEASVRVAKETTIYSKSGTGLQKHIFKN